MSAAITVIATFTSKPDTIDDLKRELAILVGETRKETGCLSYILHQSPEKPTEFAMIERWADETALNAHFGMPHTKAVFAVAPELLASAVSITRWIEVAG